jgi:hypothetical protein
MRRMLVALAAAAGLVASVAPARAADQQGGCKENGQAVAFAAHAFQPFGQVVRLNAPINDDVAAFKAAFCAG